MTEKKNLDERSERSLPLNIETVLVEGARKPKQFTPDEESEKLKKDGSEFGRGSTLERQINSAQRKC